MENPFEIIDQRLSNLEKMLEVLINSQKNIHEDSYMTRKQVCDLLKCHINTLDDYTHTGLIPTYQIGKKILFKRSEVMKAPKKIN